MSLAKTVKRRPKHISVEALKELFSPRVIAFRPEFSRLGESSAQGRLGSEAGLMLSQALWLSENQADAEGWFYISQEGWAEITGLSEKRQVTARNSIKGQRLWEEQLRGSDNGQGGLTQGKLHYKLNLEAIRQALEDLVENSPRIAAQRAAEKREIAAARRDKNRKKYGDGRGPDALVPPKRRNTQTTSLPVGNGAQNDLCFSQTEKQASPIDSNKHLPEVETVHLIDVHRPQGAVQEFAQQEPQQQQRAVDTKNETAQQNDVDDDVVVSAERTIFHQPAIVTETMDTAAAQLPGTHLSSVPRDADLISRLRRAGLSQVQAEHCARDHADECAAQIAELPHRGIRNKGARGAILFRAITEGWSTPHTTAQDEPESGEFGDSGESSNNVADAEQAAHIRAANEATARQRMADLSAAQLEFLELQARGAAIKAKHGFMPANPENEIVPDADIAAARVRLLNHPKFLADLQKIDGAKPAAVAPVAIETPSETPDTARREIAVSQLLVDLDMGTFAISELESECREVFDDLSDEQVKSVVEEVEYLYQRRKAA